MALDLFMNLIGTGAPVKGESTDELCAGMILLKTFKMSVFAAEIPNRTQTEDKKKRSAPSAAAKTPLNKDTASQPVSFTITKGMDTSTPFLFLNYFQAATAKPIPFTEADVYFRYPTTMPTALDTASFLIFRFYNLFVCQYTMEFEVAEEEATRPLETIQFSFERYQMQYRSQTGTIGSTSVRPLGWDFVKKVTV
jgi:type VI protein secretion system component Hcp